MDPIVGRGKYTYKVDENWQRPPEWLDVKACAVSIDSEDRVYCFNRNEAHPIVIFDRDGNFVGSWGEGLFRFPHAIRIVQENGRDVDRKSTRLNSSHLGISYAVFCLKKKKKIKEKHT